MGGVRFWLAFEQMLLITFICMLLYFQCFRDVFDVAIVFFQMDFNAGMYFFISLHVLCLYICLCVYMLIGICVFICVYLQWFVHVFVYVCVHICVCTTLWIFNFFSEISKYAYSYIPVTIEAISLFAILIASIVRHKSMWVSRHTNVWRF